MDQQFDLLVIGGGINGAGIARDAAGRGLRVLLCEQDDLASHTSSASSKLIHGGLRYLEHHEYRLVSKALAEREVLMRAAPHIIWPLRFVMPHDRALRPAWLIRLGLWLYDHLDFGKRKLLAGSRAIDLREHPAGAPLQQQYRQGFVYSDGWVQDARLVVLNAMDAAERGAEILPRTRCIGARRDAEQWRVQLQACEAGVLCGETREVRARCLVNAAGPWAASLLSDQLQHSSRHQLRQVKGSHIVVRKLFEHDHAYIFQLQDQRIIFALPFEEDYTLIGTTDLDYVGDPAAVCIDAAEIEYLCTAVNRYFTQAITARDVVWSFAGVRPLVEDEAGDASAVTRDYLLELDTEGAPLLSVFGGKITTYRKLAEEVIDLLAPRLGCDAKAWSGEGAALPGGDIAEADFEAFFTDFCQRHRWLPASLARRYTRAYGTRVERLLGTATGLADLGEHCGDDVYAAELRYLLENEWARSVEDVLWRRSKLGLHVSAETQARMQAWLAANSGSHGGVRAE